MRASRPVSPQTPEVAFLWEGEWYAFPLFTPTSWVEVDITPFTQRLGSGPLTLSDLTGIAAVEQLSFAGGSGQERLVELNRYYTAKDLWTVSYDRGVTLGPQKLKTISLSPASYVSSSASGMAAALCTYGSGEDVRQVGAFAFGQSVWVKKAGADPVDVTGNLASAMAARGIINGIPSDGMNYWTQVSDKGTVTTVDDGGSPAFAITYDTSQGSSSDTFIGLKSVLHPTPPNREVQVTFEARHVSGDNVGLKVIVKPYYYNPEKYVYTGDPSHEVTQTFTLTSTYQSFTVNTLDMSVDGRYRFFTVEFRVEGTTSPQTSTVHVRNVSSTYLNTADLGVNDLLWNGYALFAATDAGIFYLDESRVDASPNIFTGSPASYTWKKASWRVADAGALCVADGFMWYAEKYSNLLHYGSDFLGRDLEWGSGADSHPMYWKHWDATVMGDIGAIQVGSGLTSSKRLVGFNNAVYAFRHDGAWAVYHDGVEYVSRNVLNFPPSPRNFQTVTVHDGSLVFVAQGRVWRYTGDTLVDVTPDERGSLGYATDVAGVASTGDLLWGVLHDSKGTVLVWGGGSWHAHTTIFPDDGTHVYPVGMAAYAVADYYNGNTQPVVLISYISAIGSGVVVGEEYFFKAVEPNYFHATDGEGKLITSWVSGGLEVVEKCVESVTVFYGFDMEIPYPPPLGSENWCQRIIVELEYRLPDGSTATVELGRLHWNDALPNKKTNSVGISEVIRRTRTLDVPKIVSREFRLIFTLQNHGVASYTPRLYGYMVKYVPRPPYLRGYNAHLLVSDGAYSRAGATNRLSAREQVALLWAMRDSRRPVFFRDVHGRETWVYVSALKVVNLGEREGVRGHDYRVEISLVETEEAFGGPSASAQ